MARLCFVWLALLAPSCLCDNLRVAYEWKKVDYAYPDEAARQEALRNGDFVPENNIPMGVEVFQDRLFVTIPRWRKGVPASLTYISLNDSTSRSPQLIPYPNWSAHDLSGGSKPELVSPFRVRADRCGRLWAMDSGMDDIMGESKKVTPPQLVVYDLRTDELLRRYVFPEDQVESDSFFANIAIEDANCDDTYVYAADLKGAALVVYSWRRQSSWRIKHHYFNQDPTAGDFNMSGLNFQWDDALFGLGLSAPDQEGFSTLYFHPMVSTHEFSISTKILRDESWRDDAFARQHFDDFKLLGSRGPNAQSSVEFVDKSTGVLFYALINLNAIACWKTSNKEYTIKSQGRIFMSNETMVYPSDMIIDANSNLWVMSNKLPIFMFSKLDFNDTNFRVLTASVKDAIRGTACDTTPHIDLIKKFANNTIQKIKNLTTSGSGVHEISTFALVYTIAISFYHMMH